MRNQAIDAGVHRAEHFVQVMRALQHFNFQRFSRPVQALGNFLSSLGAFGRGNQHSDIINCRINAGENGIGQAAIVIRLRANGGDQGIF